MERILINLFVLLIQCSTVPLIIGQELDDSCLLECDTESKVNLRQKYCEQCLRMPIRFGRPDPGYNNKLAIIFKSMWKNSRLHHIPQEILDIIKMGHKNGNHPSVFSEDFQVK